MRISDWSSDVCSSDLRTDFSLARLKHYTGTPPEHVQRFVLFTNYHRYVDEFVAWACGELEKGGRYHALSGAGGVYVTPGTADSAKMIADSAWRSEEHTSELQSLMRISYAVFCLKKKKQNITTI